MSESHVTVSKDNLHLKVIRFLFPVSLLLYLVGMLFPELRVWGIGQWVHFPWYFYVAAAILAVAGVIVASRWMARRRDSSDQDSQSISFVYFGVVVFVVFLAAFYLLRVRLHFLGDGYTLLANITLDNPIIKSRNLGEALIHGWVYSLLPGEPSAKALLAYQLVSYAGGVVFLLTVLVGASKLFENLWDRVLFSLGMLSGGYMLLFFGYTEHYSLFVTSVALFGMVGLLILKGQMSRWYILPALVLTVFLHVFGVVLIPAAFYVLLVDSGPGRWVKNRGMIMKILPAAAIAVAGLVIFGYFYSTNYFFRFAFVPILHDRFTLDNYTLFSPAHFVDIINLSLLLLPGLVVIVAALFMLVNKQMMRGRDIVFLLILLLSTLAAIMVFDPKMGMARDWDLFSFFGIPLALGAYYFLTRNRAQVKEASILMIAAIALGFFALVPRVIGQAVEPIGLAQIYDYARMDKKKSLFLFQQLHEYYWEHGQYERSPLLYYDFDRNFPEYRLITEGATLRQEGRFRESVGLFERAVVCNPTFAPAYSNLGSAYIEMGQYDSAIAVLSIALGLSPHRVEVLTDLGRAYERKGELSRAEEYFRRARSVDADYMPAGLALLDILADREDEVEFRRLLAELAQSEEAPASIHRLLGEYYRSEGDTAKAEEQFRMARLKSTAVAGDSTTQQEGD